MQKATSKSQEAPEGLVRAPTLIVRLFPNPKDRPTIRTIRRMTATRQIPFVRFGGGVFFNIVDVRAALMKQATAKVG